jgi:hypothetical protein
MTPGHLATFEGLAADAGLVFYFSGEFTPSGIVALGETLRRRLGEIQVPGKPSRRLFSAFVEMAQNVLHYAAEAGTAAAAGGAAPQAHRGTIAIGNGGDHHWIACTNDVGADHAERLRDRLQAIAGMGPAELREAYQRQLQDEGHEAADPLSRGAGLGLLTIARAASAPLEHAFAPLPGAEGLTRFVLCARLDHAPPTQDLR